MPIINKISPVDLCAVYEVFELCFPDFAPIDESMRQFLHTSVNWSISYKAEQDGKIVGFYLLGERNLSVIIAS